MSENVLKTLQQLVQDVIAPDVRELKVRMGSQEKQIELLQKHMDFRFEAMDQKMEQRFLSMDQKNDAQFNALMSAISESRRKPSYARVVAALSA